MNNLDNDNFNNPEDREDSQPTLDEGMADLVGSLQDMVDSLQADNDSLRAQLAAQPAPTSDESLTALAKTVSDAWTKGHPSKLEHLNSLLVALGASEIR